ncbi:hypothetical protein C5748_25570 [Phyllobacterium phragmitis]|uniref:Methyltransferase domain-containing protein n=1 Tax=Phyllobacterium phragmitis TaxID=2670329 RepID=A0A2S9IJI6_9HYPH|nr:class I SAM-dependent methyltransferase [Phyllobacterium phragmitis]PRD40694.1 hypothetical protein C5748_25570 [Phyllobacterium phragmitis]
MSYVLEHPGEFERLERQSALPAYDYQRELEGIEVKDGACILDAGCGSGIVSRYLAGRFPRSRIIACDYSAPILREARERAKDVHNLSFEEKNLFELDFEDSQFDLIVSRFVLHHQSCERQERIISELVRVLKPAGKLIIIDVDGIILNLYPQTFSVKQGLKKLAATDEVDLFVGRKLPHLFSNAGLASISWAIETTEFRGAEKKSEIGQMRERFANASAFFERVIGSAQEWERFREDYLECLADPHSVSFFNKFIVSAIKR